MEEEDIQNYQLLAPSLQIIFILFCKAEQMDMIIQHYTAKCQVYKCLWKYL